MRELVLRKRSRDRDSVCITYSTLEGEYLFIFEACEEGMKAVFRNDTGDLVGILDPGETITITQRGEYLICIEGREGTGSVWVEWLVPGSTGQPVENCCDELRERIRILEERIQEILDNLPEQITLTAGNNITITKENNNYTISSTGGGGGGGNIVLRSVDPNIIITEK